MFFFSELTLPSNNLGLTSYLSGIYLESWFSLVMGRSLENMKGKTKTDKRKTLKNEEKQKGRMRGKASNNNIHLWF